MAKKVYKTTITLFSGSKKDAQDARREILTAIGHILNQIESGPTFVGEVETTETTRSDPSYNSEWDQTFG
jgi:hypothetical protein